MSKRHSPLTTTLFSWNDFLWSLVAVFMFATVVLIADAKKKSEEGVKPPGNVTVFITWPPGDNDVDLWVMGPGEKRPVGYSNKSGIIWSLLRDDLGTTADITGINMESAYSRGAPAGEYVLNLHCYRCVTVPQRVQVEVSTSKPNTGKGMAILGTATVMLFANGQERTAMRFALDGKGNLVPGSINTVFKPLRAADSSGTGSGNNGIFGQ